MDCMTTQELPNWQLTSIFPSLQSPEFREATLELERRVAGLERFMTEHGIDGETGPGTAAAADALDQLIERLNDTTRLFSDVRAYLTVLVTTDAFNEEAQAKQSELQALATRYSMIGTKFTAWLGQVDLDAITAASPLTAAHLYALERNQQLAGHLLEPAAEDIVAKLAPSGGTAWSQLHGALISRGTIRVKLPGREEAEYNVSELYSLQADADPAVRKAAHEAEIELLARNEVSYAAAMNSIKGQVGVLAREAGWDSALSAALFQNSITADSLAALQEACRESFPVLRRYLKAKARYLGKEQLEWSDLQAPVAAGEQRTYSWSEARDFIVSKFRLYSDELADFAARTFEEGWLDAPSRKGKTNGAYCIAFPGQRESRIMLNFAGTLDDLFTIAHELGHAYHNEQLFRAGRTSLQRQTPMTLAETASIFCETIVFNAVLEEADEAGKLEILEQDLAGATQLVIDIHSRFIFEKTVFERRRERALSVTELNDLMLAAQQDTYGEGLAEGSRHRLMWAFKGHYYSTGRSFYNYPYTFGYLFGLGLYQEFLRQPEGFRERYDDLLSSTGMDSAANLAGRFGINIEATGFWRGGLAALEARVAEYERLTQ
jgi:pepF/M3 family oligoendopeptidase